MKIAKASLLGLALSVLSIVQAAPPSGGGESPDKTGIHAGASFGFSGFNGQGSGGIIYTVPAGKRLVIETATALCAVAPTEKVYRAYIYSTAGGAGVSHHLIPVAEGTDGSPNFGVHLVNWSGRLYADAGPVQMGAFRNGTTSGSYTCYYTLSGYLVTVP